MTRRLLLTYLSFALLILVALEVPLGYVHHRNEMQHAFEQLEHDAEVLAVFVDAALAQGDAAQLEVLAHETAQRLGGNVDVVDARAQLLTSTHPGGRPPGSLAAAGDIQQVLSGQGRVSTGTGVSDGVRVMSVAVAVHPGMVAQGAIRISVPVAPLQARIRQFWLMLVGAGVIVLAAAALTAYALARWISRPVRALEEATRQAADGTPPPPLATTTGPPELRRLAVTFAATANRLQGLIASQRAFIGHASHQLKTPLAALRLRLENLEPDVGAAVELHVVDQGLGLPADQLARALDPFWRAPGAPKGGTGLGLSLVRRLAELSGGRVVLEPGPGGGIDAVVTLPAAAKEEDGPGNTAEHRPAVSEPVG